MNIVFAFAAGLIFGLGLLVSGMANPAKVLGFLDVAGAFDPSLGFVMAGALAVFAPLHRLTARRKVITLPGENRVDRRLLAGSALFGVGWGLSGICPGPALVVLAGLSVPALVFVAAMIAGALAFRVFDELFTRKTESPLTPATDA